MEKLTAKQQKIYDYIQTFSAEHGYPPSVREIGAAVGLKSPSTVHFHLKGLEEAGVIIKAEGKTRAITLSGTGRPVAEEQDPHADQIPVVGSVAAGSPILAEECIEDYLTFDTQGLSGEHFALRVRGESMLDAGILPGDLVVVHRQQEVHSGEIVVACLRMRPPSRPIAGRTAMCGSCRPTTTIPPSTATGPRSWARWWR